ncbi:MAG: methyltransferase domain-containing protein [Nitriliruptorales bacterium]|nr:methyltransferase domain-containing protein [Nitriliruptorales bacterium]
MNVQPLTRRSDDTASAEGRVRRVHEILRRHGAAIPIRLWNGVELGPPDQPYRVVLNQPWSLRQLLVPPTDLSAGEAYVFGAVDVDGSMVEALRSVARLRTTIRLGWSERVELGTTLLSLATPPKRRERRGPELSGRTHSKQRDAQAVRFHYDVGNDFYRLFLDAQLVYSCGYFSDEDPSDPASDPQALDRAQLRKLDMVCRKLRLREGDRLLDIGCGWGSLVVHAAVNYGARAVGITLSTQQAELARERARRAGVADRVEIRVEDYRDTSGTFDAVASIGMFEHVGENMFTTYFARAYELTAPGGRFLNHAITTGRRDTIRALSHGRSFVGRYVFPDGTLAPAHVAVRMMEQAGFELLDVHQLRRHYARTLRHWVHNLEENVDSAREVAGEATYRTWRAYMSGSVVGFEDNDLGVTQVLGVKGDHDLPLGRQWMEPISLGTSSGGPR